MSTLAHISLVQYELMVDAGAFSGKCRQRIELIRGGNNNCATTTVPPTLFDTEN